MTEIRREGSLEAPTRHPIDWKSGEFYDEPSLFTELERVYDICHGCRRCVALCHAFPTLFDLVDESETFEVDGVKKEDYWQVVDHCYLCDLCYMTKCPYVPPHEWNVDFPHLMLRAKAQRFKQGEVKLRDKLLTSTDTVGSLAGIPVVASDFPLWRSIVEGAECGLLVDPLRPDEIAKAIDWLMAHPQEAAQMGANGKRAVRETYNWSHEAEKLIGLYERLGD